VQFALSLRAVCVKFALSLRYKCGVEWKECRVPSETLTLFPPFRLDVLNAQLWRDDELVTVRPKPFAVLAYLATHAGRLVTGAELRQAVWPQTYVGEGLLRGYIREVRSVLGDDAEMPQFIETVARRGYRFIGKVVSSQYSVADKPQAEGAEQKLTPDNWLLTTRMVGRDAELRQLHCWLEKAASGTRQVVFVTGESGIGRTTVVDIFLQSLGRMIRD
jgi:DNA-binding winged helix-turn-helix (wHTH) protein